jgi:hypothetical protein
LCRMLLRGDAPISVAGVLCPLCTLLALSLGGCVSAEERAAQAAQLTAQRAEMDDTVCRSYGAEKGSAPYIQCRMARDQQRANADAIASAQAAQASQATMAAGLALMQASQPRTLPSNSMTCNSVSLGGGTRQINCF